MSGREWKPGDVALVTEYDPPLIALVARKQASSKQLWFKYADGGFDVAGRVDIGDGDVLDVEARPLVVIDPEDREQRDELVRAISERLVNQGVPFDILNGAVTSALCSLVTDPKPEEPTGLGAVVEDSEGQRWVRLPTPGVDKPWTDAAGIGMHAHWTLIASVRVLSEGVQAGDPQ